MIALLSSTLSPPDTPLYGGNRKSLSDQERLVQTQESIDSLRKLGFSEIFIADNSPKQLPSETITALSTAKLLSIPQYPFHNKGLNEAYLLLSALPFLPNALPLIKLSARYSVNRNLINELSSYDLAAKIETPSRGPALMSTRYYAVKNKDVLERLLSEALRLAYRLPFQVVGPRSLLQQITRILFPKKDTYPYHDPTYSLEHVCALALESSGISIKQCNTLGVQGTVAGETRNRISE
ncbi:MAG: hypothetical protein AAF558_04450 [Verrucomicrobiota bacterium]